MAFMAVVLAADRSTEDGWPALRLPMRGFSSIGPGTARAISYPSYAVPHAVRDRRPAECSSPWEQTTPRSRSGGTRYGGSSAAGRWGGVYEAWDPALGRTIALKMVGAFSLSATERETYERRFQTEARAAAGLALPGIVVVHDVGRDPGSGLLFMALEYLDGETLADRLASGRRFPWREALRITARVAEALHHAHALGVVHRDVKPANVMILRSGEPKILDFGIARVDAGHLTSPGDLFGTPLYMSPEQALGQPVDARSDLFSLGTIAYAMLTDHSPFAGPKVPRHPGAGRPPRRPAAVGAGPRASPGRRRRAGPRPGEVTRGSLPQRPDDVRGHRGCARRPPAASPRRLDAGADRRAHDRVARTRRGWGGGSRPRGGRASGAAHAGALALPAGAGGVRCRRRDRRRPLLPHPEDGTYWLDVSREAHRRPSVLTTLARMEPRPALATPPPEPAIRATPDVVALPSPGARAGRRHRALTGALGGAARGSRYWSRHP